MNEEEELEMLGSWVWMGSWCPYTRIEEQSRPKEVEQRTRDDGCIFGKVRKCIAQYGLYLEIPMRGIRYIRNREEST